MYRRDLTRIELKLEDVNNFRNQKELEQQLSTDASKQTSGQANASKSSGSPTTSTSTHDASIAARHARIGLRKNFLPSSN